MASRGEIYSTRADFENRTYFFNVKENRRGDVFLNIVESNKKEEKEGFDRHQIMVFEEDMAIFMAELKKASGIVLKKGELAKKELPQKFKKKTPGGANPRSKTVPKGAGSSQKSSQKSNQTSASNLRRKKVSLKLKTKRADDE